MNETTPTPLPPPPVPSGSHAFDGLEAESPATVTHPVAVFFAAAAAGVALAIIVGGPIGFAITAMGANECSPGDGWCGLGALVVGVFVGVVAGAIAYVLTGLAVIRRLRPAGNRAAHVAAHLLAPPVVVFVVGLLSELASSLG